MKINFCVNTCGLTGGIKVVFIYANRLQKLGHEVKIIYPYNLEKKWLSLSGFKAIAKMVRMFFLRLAGRDKINWFPLEAEVIRLPNLSAKYLPDAEAVIATANETADWVAELPKEKGEKFYFVQDYEIWTRDKKLVDKTYQLPLKKIVIASWLKKLMKDKFKEKVEAVISNGVDLSKFYNRHKKINQQKRIIMLYHILPKKGVKDGIRAYQLVKKRHPEIKLTFFSAYAKGSDVPEEADFYFRPSPKKLRQLYCQADIYLSPSWQEGCQLTPMEAMACQTAVVATNVGGIPDYAIPLQTALVVPPHQIKAMAEAVIKLVEDEDELKRISYAGYCHIKKFSWASTAKKFEEILKKYVREEQN